MLPKQTDLLPRGCYARLVGFQQVVQPFQLSHKAPEFFDELLIIAYPQIRRWSVVVTVWMIIQGVLERFDQDARISQHGLPAWSCVQAMARRFAKEGVAN